MPIVDGIGFGECTPWKLECLRKLFDWHLAVAYHVFANGRSHTDYLYHYIDATAGKGITQEYGNGSPRLFLNRVSISNLSQRYRADFIERDLANYAALVQNVSGHNPRVHCHLAMYQGKLGELLTAPWLGLLFVDPTGDAPCIDSLTMAANRCHYLDILCYVSAANLKRNVGAGIRLADYVHRIDKRYWLIRQPDGKHQWTFLFGSNMAWTNYRGIEFYRLDSPAGQAILDKLTTTAKERQACLQPQLI